MNTVVRTPFDRPKTAIVLTGGKTHQSFKDSCCINRLMASVDRTGILPVNPRVKSPQYGDVSGLNKPYDQLISESLETLHSVNVAAAAKRAEAVEARKAAAKAARDAEIEAAVQKRLAERGSATS